jgi:hypothetical protein
VPVFEGRFASLVVDCSEDPVALARWWQGFLGGELEIDPEGYASWYRDGYPPIDFVPVPESKTVKNRLHIDLRPDDYEAAVQVALDAGATRAGDVYDGDRWTALRDPAGNEFCILRPRQD